MFRKYMIITLSLWMIIIKHSSAATCRCYCPTEVGQVETKVCSRDGCATACSNRFDQCKNKTVYSCCGNVLPDFFHDEFSCGSHPSNSTCDCLCGQRFLGGASTLSTSPTTYAKSCAEACFNTYSQQCSASDINGCSSTYPSQVCAYYKKNYTCDCSCNGNYQGQVPSNICSGSECARVCHKAYLTTCDAQNVSGCTTGCGPQICKTPDTDPSFIHPRITCYCHCPTFVGTTLDPINCFLCQLACMDDFPMCKMNQSTAFGTCKANMTFVPDGNNTTDPGNTANSLIWHSSTYLILNFFFFFFY